MQRFGLHFRPVVGMRWWRFGLILAAISSLALPRSAEGATCNGFIAISYPVTHTPNVIGSIDRVKLELSAGSIQNGTTLTVDQVAFYLDCRNKGCTPSFQTNCNASADCGMGQSCVALGTTCIDDGNVMNYLGNITTTCATTWSATMPNGSNQVIFTATPDVVLQANGTACSFEFDIQKAASQSNDTTPDRIEEVAAFINSPCNNGSASSSAQSGFLSVTTAQLPPPERPVPAASAAVLAIITAGLTITGCRRIRRR